MPTASKSGSHRAIRRNWREGDRSRFQRGPRAQPRPNPFSELAAALTILIRFHQTHPDWFPPPARRRGDKPPVTVSPEWAAAIRQAYHPAPAVPVTPPASESMAVPANSGNSCLNLTP